MIFSKQQSEILHNIIISRRDIRGNNFRKKKIKNKKLNNIIEAGLHAPSVGFSQPWKFIVIKNKKIKNKIFNNFNSEYNQSKKYFKNRPQYNTLKLEGIKESPINLAVYYKKNTTKILGQTSQKLMGQYSTVCAIQNMWLMARSLNIGLGWVSILKPKKVNKILKVSSDYKLVGYLCLGYPKEFLKVPELELLKWNKKISFDKVVSFID